MERRVRQQAREVTQLHETIVRKARIIEACAAQEEALWRNMKDCWEDRETKWDDRHVDNILWKAGITDLTVKVLATVKGGEAATTQDA
jgi:ABC-type cobalamin/Fe3+-siderophores transport system ATPase subunit